MWRQKSGNDRQKNGGMAIIVSLSAKAVLTLSEVDV
jgi:hypothetical protein